MFSILSIATFYYFSNSLCVCCFFSQYKEFQYLKLFFYMRAYYFLVYLKKLYNYAKITINRDSKYKTSNYYGTYVFGVEY